MKRIAFVFAAALLLPTVAAAQNSGDRNPGQGAYITIYGGPSFFPDSKVTDPAIPSTVDVEAGLDTGFQIGGAIGYHFDRNFRGEMEGFYRRNDLNSLSASGTAFGISFTAATPVSGEATNAGMMGNLYWDFVNSSKFTPYIGGGVGFTRAGVDITIGSSSASVNDTVFAYQAMAGVKYAVTSKVSVNLGYRYFACSDPKFDTTEVENQTHNVDFGLTYDF
jgi:opacity protein-like surface antigen